jgi:hypothetical protein
LECPRRGPRARTGWRWLRTPVHELASAGHRVLVEAGAGEASSISDEGWEEAEAVVAGDAGRVYDESELVVKIHGPVEEERRHLREDMILFSFLSLTVNGGSCWTSRLPLRRHRYGDHYVTATGCCRYSPR